MSLYIEHLAPGCLWAAMSSSWWKVSLPCESHQLVLAVREQVWPQPEWDIYSEAAQPGAVCTPSLFLTVIWSGNWFYLFPGDSQPPRS